MWSSARLGILSGLGETPSGPRISDSHGRALTIRHSRPVIFLCCEAHARGGQDRSAPSRVELEAGKTALQLSLARRKQMPEFFFLGFQILLGVWAYRDFTRHTFNHLKPGALQGFDFF